MAMSSNDDHPVTHASHGVVAVGRRNDEETRVDDKGLSLAAYPRLAAITSPRDLRHLDLDGCEELAEEIRTFIVDAVTRTGGHLGSNLGAVELTVALHRVFDSPRDVILWDTGHQAYVHKLLTGRR
jgi:1-deoxy-D-xylulose-5-phosphate synthase